MDIRPYQAADEAGCAAVFASHGAVLPASKPASFYVMEHNGEILGCGGFEGGELRCGMTRKDMQRQGLGRFMLLYRLRELGKSPNLVYVTAQVPEQYAAFYEKNGLKRTGQTDANRLVEFRMKLQVCS